MLKHARAGHSYTDARRQFEREGVSSSLEKHLSPALGMGWRRGAPLWTAGPQVDLRRCVVAVRSEIFKERPRPLPPPLLGRRQWLAGSRKSVLRQNERLGVGVGVHCFIRIEAVACFPHSDDAQDFRSDAGEREQGLTRLQREDINLKKSLHISYSSPV